MKQKTNEGKKEPFSGGKNKVFWFIPTQTKTNQKQTKNELQKQLRRIQGSDEVAQRATSLDPKTYPNKTKAKTKKKQSPTTKTKQTETKQKQNKTNKEGFRTNRGGPLGHLTWPLNPPKKKKPIKKHPPHNQTKETQNSKTETRT